MTRVIFKEQDGRPAQLIGKDSGDLEIFIDGIWGLTVTKTGICKVNLYTLAPELDEYERREVAARLVMPIDTFFAAKDFFVKQCERLIAEGIVTQQVAESEPTAETHTGDSAR